MVKMEWCINSIYDTCYWIMQCSWSYNLILNQPMHKGIWWGRCLWKRGF